MPRNFDSRKGKNQLPANSNQFELDSFVELSSRRELQEIGAFTCLATQDWQKFSSSIEDIGISTFGKERISLEQFQEYIDHPPGWIDPSKALSAFFSFVKVADQIVGFTFSMHSTEYESDPRCCYEIGDCYLCMVAVHQENQGLGLLKPLMIETTQAAKNLGYTQLAMHATTSSNFAIQQLEFYGDRVLDHHHYQDPIYGPQAFFRVRI